MTQGSKCRVQRWLVLAAVLIPHTLMAYADEPEATAPLAPQDEDRCLKVLRAGLAGDDFWPAMHAAEALTVAGHGDEVMAALGDRLLDEQDDQRRCGLARELARTGDRRRVDVLFTILAGESAYGHIHAAESLYKIGEVGDGRLLQAAFAQGEDERLQLMAAAALARAGSPQAMAKVREQLGSRDREIRKVAAWILSLLGDRRDVEPLARMLETEEDELAGAYAANALACLGDERGRQALARNLESADPMVRTYSADFAGYSRAVDARSKLMALLDDEKPDVRIRAAQSLLALARPPAALGLPVSVSADDFSVDVYPASKENPRYSEGSILALADGSLLNATTEFIGGGADHATARIVARRSSDGGRAWGEKRVLQENVGQQNVMSVTLRRLPGPATDPQSSVVPSATPPVYATPSEALRGSVLAPLGMFYLVKNSATDLKVYLRVSRDQAESFGEPILVTDEPGYHVMNNDRVTVLSKPPGRIVCPIAWCDDVAGGGHFISFVYLSDDGGATWRRGRGSVDLAARGAMEPEVIELADGRLMMFIRTQFGHVATSTSSDGGETWGEPARLSVPAPEAPATIRRIPSTGDLLLVWNNVAPPPGERGQRTPLTAAISRDEGQNWTNLRDLETSAEESYAYTSVLFHGNRVLLGYYVGDNRTGRISSRFRSLPVTWFY